MALTDPETCSWCTDEVEDSTLVMTSEGRLCPACVTTDEGQKALIRYLKEATANAEYRDNFDIEYSALRDVERFFE